MNVLAVGIGGFFGAILRYSIGKWIPTPSGFPLGTLTINLFGCLFLAWFFTITANRWNINSKLKLALELVLLEHLRLFQPSLLKR